MFTVLVRKPNDHETLYECQELEKEPNAILMRGEHLGSGESKGLEVLGPGGQTMAWDWDRKVSDKPKEGDDTVVFVMNRFGKTVQTYHL